MLVAKTTRVVRRTPVMTTHVALSRQTRTKSRIDLKKACPKKPVYIQSSIKKSASQPVFQRDAVNSNSRTRSRRRQSAIRRSRAISNSVGGLLSTVLEFQLKALAFTNHGLHPFASGCTSARETCAKQKYFSTKKSSPLPDGIFLNILVTVHYSLFRTSFDFI